MDYEFRDSTFLSETKGEVRAYAEKIPRKIAKPLRRYQKGLSARKSNDRSAILKVGKDWYKFKGCNPQKGFFSFADTIPELKGTILDVEDPDKNPKGAMSNESVELEIKHQSLLVDKLREFNLPAPLYPIATYDYELEGRHCAVSITRGDLRYSEFIQKVASIRKNIPDFKNQFNRIYGWLGFAQHMTKETFGKLGDESNHLGNYVFYKVNKGYGISRIDFPRREEEDMLIKPNLIGNMEQHLVALLDEFNQKKDISRILEDPHVVETINITGIWESNDSIMVYAPKSKLPSEVSMVYHFEKGMEGDFSEPISKEFVEGVMASDDGCLC